MSPHLLRPCRSFRGGAIPALLLLMSLVVLRSAAAQTFGTLSNFDVFNDTGTECHGFEIELDGIPADKVVYTFGGTYDLTVAEYVQALQARARQGGT
jgi:hypothetical protein